MEFHRIYKKIEKANGVKTRTNVLNTMPLLIQFWVCYTINLKTQQVSLTKDVDVHKHDAEVSFFWILIAQFPKSLIVDMILISLRYWLLKGKALLIQPVIYRKSLEQ